MVEENFADVANAIVAGFTLVICIIGLVANCFVIFTILVLKEHKKAVTNWFMLQLAVADTLFLLTLPFKASQKLNQAWIYSVGLCKAQESILYINYFASIMFLIVMSMDRYVAVCHTMSNSLQNLRKPIASYVVTVVVWAIAIGMAVPIMLFSQVQGLDPNCKCRGEFPRNSPEAERCIELYGPMITDEERADCESRTPANRVFCVRFDEPNNRVDNSPDATTSLPENSTMSEYISTMSTAEYATMLTTEITTIDTTEMETTDLATRVTNIDENFTTVGGDAEMLTMEDELYSAYGSGELEFISPECHYFQYPEGWFSFLWFIFIAMFLIPLAIMSICYGLIIHRILASAMATSSRVDSDRKRITIMCIILVCAFVFGWAWFHAVHIAKIQGIQLPGENCIILTEIGTLLAFLHSALNPLLYIFLGSGFGRKWQAIKESPTTRYIITLKTRSTDFFHSNSRARTKTMDKSSSHVPSHDTGHNVSKVHSSSGSTKQATAVTNGAKDQ